MAEPGASWRGTRVLVLGAGGFIGRWVARALTAAGADLHAAARDVDAAGIILTRWGADATLHACDATDAGAAAHLLRALQPVCVFNLAGYGVDPTERDPDLAERINAALPAELAAAMPPIGAWKGQQVVHTGSALEYGTAPGDLAEEGPATPTTLYGTTKLAGTLALERAAVTAGVRAVAARLFTVYGAGEHAGRLLPTLLAARSGTGTIPLTAGAQHRDFTWVGDVADGLLRLAAQPGSGIVNLATGQLTTVRTFISVAADVLGIAPDRLAFGALPTRPEEMVHDAVRVTRLQTLTAWLPPTSIAAGIRASTHPPPLV